MGGFQNPPPSKILAFPCSGGIREYAEPFCSGVQVTLAMPGGVFCFQLFFLQTFKRAVSELSNLVRNLESGKLFFQGVVENCYKYFRLLIHIYWVTSFITPKPAVSTEINVVKDGLKI